MKSARRVRALVVGLLSVVFALVAVSSSARAEIRAHEVRRELVLCLRNVRKRRYARDRRWSPSLRVDRGNRVQNHQRWVSRAGIPDGSLRDIIVDLPRGFVGDPNAVPFCEPTDLASDTCGVSSQVGVIEINSGVAYSTVAVRNVRPRFGEVAAFRFKVLGVPIIIHASLRPDRYTVRATTSDISQAIRVAGLRLALWGDPSNPIHDPQRGRYYQCGFPLDDPNCLDPTLAADFNGGFASGILGRPFLTNPTYCGAEPVTAVRTRSWEDPSVWVASSVTATTPTDCDKLVFDPKIEPRFATTKAESPTGLRFALDIPQSSAIPGVATPTLRRASVTLQRESR